MNYWVVGNEDMHKAMWRDIGRMENGHYIDGIFHKMSRFTERIMRICLETKAAGFLPEKLKRNFYRYYTLTEAVTGGGENCVILTDNRVCYYSLEYLKYLKKKYGVCFVLVYLNPYSTSGEKVLKFLELSDYVFTYDAEDASEYGFEFFTAIYSEPDEYKKIGNEGTKEADLFYIGEARARLSILQECFYYLDENGVVCDYSITGVGKEEQRYEDKIRYNMPLEYAEVIERVKKCNCVLEVLREGQGGTTLRVLEAVVYNKKLLTNNARVKEQPFYDERYIRVFRSIDEIPVDFVKERIPVAYEYKGECSPIRLVDKIEELLELKYRMNRLNK